jgi:hypothetical protein
MIRRLFRFVIRLSLVIGAAAAAYRVVQARRPSPELPEDGAAWPPAPRPVPTEPKLAESPVAPAPKAAATPTTATSTTAKPPASPANEKAPAKPGEAWVDPDAAGACPITHPVKAKLASSIFHLPGMAAYERTNADRCYRDEASAEADGLRKAKR